MVQLRTHNLRLIQGHGALIHLKHQHASIKCSICLLVVGEASRSLDLMIQAKKKTGLSVNFLG